MARQTSAPIRSSAAEVLTYIASTGDPQDNIAFEPSMNVSKKSFPTANCRRIQ